MKSPDPSMSHPAKAARGEIWLVTLDPTRGSEIRKKRPCVVVSIDAARAFPVRLVVPLTGWQPRHEQHWTKIHVPTSARNGLDKDSAADALQIRCVSLERFDHRLGSLEAEPLNEVVSLIAMLIEAV